jgi:hypothetical protein
MASILIDILTVIDKVLWVILSLTGFQGYFSVPSQHSAEITKE